MPQTQDQLEQARPPAGRSKFSARLSPGSTIGKFWIAKISRFIRFSPLAISSSLVAQPQSVERSVRALACLSFKQLPNEKGYFGEFGGRYVSITPGHPNFIDDEEGVVISFKIEIFNRLGQKVFFTRDIFEHWDGTFRNNMLNPQVFDFYIDLECIGGKSLFHKGNITLIR